MIGLGTASLKIYVALESQDMRKGFNGLSELALVHLGGRLDRDALFVFTNGRRTRIKLRYFDGTGLWVATKRLEKGAFSWPAASRAGQKKLKLGPEALGLLLDGVDMRGGKCKVPGSLLDTGGQDSVYPYYAKEQAVFHRGR